MRFRPSFRANQDPLLRIPGMPIRSERGGDLLRFGGRSLLGESNPAGDGMTDIDAYSFAKDPVAAFKTAYRTASKRRGKLETCQVQGGLIVNMAATAAALQESDPKVCTNLLRLSDRKVDTLIKTYRGSKRNQGTIAATLAVTGGELAAVTAEYHVGLRGNLRGQRVARQALRLLTAAGNHAQKAGRSNEQAAIPYVSAVRQQAENAAAQFSTNGYIPAAESVWKLHFSLSEQLDRLSGGVASGLTQPARYTDDTLNKIATNASQFGSSPSAIRLFKVAHDVEQARIGRGNHSAGLAHNCWLLLTHISRTQRRYGTGDATKSDASFGHFDPDFVHSLTDIAERAPGKDWAGRLDSLARAIQPVALRQYVTDKADRLRQRQP